MCRTGHTADSVQSENLAGKDMTRLRQVVTGQVGNVFEFLACNPLCVSSPCNPAPGVLPCDRSTCFYSGGTARTLFADFAACLVGMKMEMPEPMA